MVVAGGSFGEVETVEDEVESPARRTREEPRSGQVTGGGPVHGFAFWLSGLAGDGRTGRLKGTTVKTLLGLGLVALIGVGLMSLGSALRPAGGQGSPSSLASGAAGGDSLASASATSNGSSDSGLPISVADLEAMIERHLERILSRILGAGKVTVAVSLETGATYVYGYDESQTSQTTQEHDGSGGTRTVTQTDSTRETVVVAQGSSSQPVIVRVDLPPLAGVVVVAGGANDSRVKALLSQAVQVLYGVPAHRVIVLAGG